MTKLEVKSTLAAAMVGLSVLTGASAALADPSHYRQVDSEGSNVPWGADQYRRADRMDQRGEHQQAQEVHEHAHDRPAAFRGAVDGYAEVAPGPGE